LQQSGIFPITVQPVPLQQCILLPFPAASSLADLGVRSEASGKLRTIFREISAHGGPPVTTLIKKEVTKKWTNLTPPQ
jgi:hypothetical protein